VSIYLWIQDWDVSQVESECTRLLPYFLVS